MKWYTFSCKSEHLFFLYFGNFLHEIFIWYLCLSFNINIEQLEAKLDYLFHGYMNCIMPTARVSTTLHWTFGCIIWAGFIVLLCHTRAWGIHLAIAESSARTGNSSLQRLWMAVRSGWHSNSWQFIYLFIILLTSHTIFPLKTSLKSIHMTMVHSKKNYERLGSSKDKHTKHFTKFCYISIF